MLLLVGGKYLVAGTETGRVRMYKLPLTGEYGELKVGKGALTQLALGMEDCYLYAACTDGSVSVLDMPQSSATLGPRK